MKRLPLAWRRWLGRQRLRLMRVAPRPAAKVRPTFCVNTWSERWKERPSRYAQCQVRLRWRLGALRGEVPSTADLVVRTMVALLLAGMLFRGIWSLSSPARGWTLGLAGLALVGGLLFLAVSDEVFARFEPRLNRQRWASSRAWEMGLPAQSPSRAQRRALKAAGISEVEAHLAKVAAIGEPWSCWDQMVVADRVVHHLRGWLDPTAGHSRQEARAFRVAQAFPWLALEVLVSVKEGQVRALARGEAPEASTAQVLQRWWDLAGTTSPDVGRHLVDQWGGDTERGQPWPRDWKVGLCAWLIAHPHREGVLTERDEAATLPDPQTWQTLWRLFAPLAQEAVLLDGLAARAPRWMPLALRVALDGHAGHREEALARRARMSDDEALLILLQLIEARPLPIESDPAEGRALAWWLPTVNPGRLLEVLCNQVTDQHQRHRRLPAMLTPIRPAEQILCHCPERLDRLTRHLDPVVQAQWMKRLPGLAWPRTLAQVRAHKLANQPAGTASRRRSRC